MIISIGSKSLINTATLKQNLGNLNCPSLGILTTLLVKSPDLTDFICLLNIGNNIVLQNILGLSIAFLRGKEWNEPPYDKYEIKI